MLVLLYALASVPETPLLGAGAAMSAQEQALLATRFLSLLQLLPALGSQHMGLKWAIVEAARNLGAVVPSDVCIDPLLESRPALLDLIAQLQQDASLDGLVACSTAGRVFAQVLPAWRTRCAYKLAELVEFYKEEAAIAAELERGQLPGLLAVAVAVEVELAAHWQQAGAAFSSTMHASVSSDVSARASLSYCSSMCPTPARSSSATGHSGDSEDAVSQEAASPADQPAAAGSHAAELFVGPLRSASLDISTWQQQVRNLTDVAAQVFMVVTQQVVQHMLDDSPGPAHVEARRLWDLYKGPLLAASEVSIMASAS